MLFLLFPCPPTFSVQLVSYEMTSQRHLGNDVMAAVVTYVDIFSGTGLVALLLPCSCQSYTCAVPPFTKSASRL